MSSKVNIEHTNIDEYVSCTSVYCFYKDKKVCLCERLLTEYGSDCFWIAETDDGNYIIVKEYDLEGFYYYSGD